MGAHEKQVGSYLALYDRAKVPMTRLGMVPVSGDQNQVFYVEGFPSFAEMEAADKKLAAAFSASPAMQAEADALEKAGGSLHASQPTMIAVFRPDLSYRPIGAAAVGKSRYVGVTRVRARMGHRSDLEAWVKQTNRAREKANLDESSSVYEVTSGAPYGTFISFSANRSLAEMDTARGGMAARRKALDEALGGEEVVRQRGEMAEATFMEVDSVLSALNPKLGNAPAQVAAGDPDFWSPKVAGKALPIKKEEPKRWDLGGVRSWVDALIRCPCASSRPDPFAFASSSRARANAGSRARVRRSADRAARPGLRVP